MYRTISIGSSILMQGQPEHTTPEGRLIIRIGERRYQGWPVDGKATRIEGTACASRVK